MTGASYGWHLGTLAAVVFVAAFAVAILLILLMMPVFRKFALAVPNARSSHKASTPQWGGLAVVASTLGVTAVALFSSPQLAAATSDRIGLVLSAAVLLVVVGTLDDVLHLSAGPKLVAQAVAIVLAIAALPEHTRILPFLPPWLENAMLFLGGLWFVNLVNFMDGIDWMMVAEVVPITAGAALAGALGALPAGGVVVALALNAAMLAFAPFNRPVARLFLGDMGSLPTGLLLLWLLFLLAGSGQLAAALLLPLYFVTDASITLLRRLRAGERVWEAHRTHFYQRASDNGLSNMQIVGRVFLVNCGLVALATMSVAVPSPAASLVAIALGAALVSGLLANFARGRP